MYVLLNCFLGKPSLKGGEKAYFFFFGIFWNL